MKTISIKQITKDYIGRISNIPELNGYDVTLKIEPKQDPNYRSTGSVDWDTFKSWETKGTEDESFSVIRKSNGNGYYYRGKLTSTVR